MNNQTDTQDTSPSLTDEDIADIKFALRSRLVIDNDMSTEDFKQIARAIEAKCRTLRAGQSEPVAVTKEWVQAYPGAAAGIINNLASRVDAIEPRRVTDEMVSRFLWWKLPADFNPDCGITFKRVYNETSVFGPQNHEPVGTNLLSADQARAMLEHVLGGAGQSPTVPTAELLFEIANELHGEFDKQTYDEKRRAEWDLQDGYEFSVSITFKQERALSQAIYQFEKARAALRSTLPQTTGGKGS